MNKTKQIWVSPNQWNGWKVHQPWNSRASALTNTKQGAIQIAESIARNQGLETKIQKKNWTIQGWNSYGNDPFPPRG
jgi:hypothetical protein